MTKQVGLLDAIALEWISSRAFLLSESLNETTKLGARAALAEGLSLGEGIPELTKRIKGFFDDTYKSRAPMVARTEVIAAANEGILHRYEEEGVDKSEFYPAPDACEKCQAWVGEYPTKEMHGIIPIHPNCRCRFIAVV